MKYLVITIICLMASYLAYSQGMKIAKNRFTVKCEENSHNVSHAHTECSRTRGCVKVPSGIHTNPLSMCSYYVAVMNGEKTW